MSEESKNLFRTSNPPLAKAEYVLPPAPEQTIAQKLARIEALERENELRAGLPFLFGWKWYPWAREFYESTNKINLLCAANQISKSSTQIRKCINWATNVELWPELWNIAPKQFWYLYPTKDQANAEFETKWKEFLPQGEYKNDPVYGWKEFYKNGDVLGIRFNSGIILYFKTYAQNVMSLQTGTCAALFCDEEMPVELYNELIFRISAAGGYFHMVFTATLGQEFWRKAMEPTESDEETLPLAWKKTVSLYDAMFYEDGSRSHWTAEKIAEVRARCSTHLEVLKRVYGRFVVLGGRVYEAFDIKRHMKERHPLPKEWLIYEGVDIGSGGEEGHPSAICFVAVRPDFRQGRIFLGWRGDGIPTTAGDVVNKHIELKKKNNVSPMTQYYDWGSKDFYTIASRMGESFVGANKGHEAGEDILNTLFKHDMLFIYEDEELVKLGSEFATLKRNTPKRKAKDDFIDAARYAVSSVPWDFSFITGELPKDYETPEKPMNDMQRQIMERRKEFDDAETAEQDRVNDEFNEWNEAYGN